MPARQSCQTASAWRKSSHSNASAECIEICCGESSVLVRDSHSRSGVMLSFERAQWSAFLERVRGGN